jgi:Leucine rich repeat
LLAVWRQGARSPRRGLKSYAGDQGVSARERQALVELYQATGGGHWTHHVGWLGPPGTECKWHGVTCGPRFGDHRSVEELDLPDNHLVDSLPPALGQLTSLEDLDLSEDNLSGSVPSELGGLSRLEWLVIFGNHLSGLLPRKLIDRWLAGQLDLRAEAPLLTDVSEIDFEFDPSALLCGKRRIRLEADGRAVLLTKRCRNETPEDRTTFCEVKQGRVWPQQFARLAWLLEKNGFYDLNANYARSITDSVFVTVGATRNGKRLQVEEYAGGGPFELWVIQTAVEGVAESIEWKKTTTLATCPQTDSDGR